MQFDSHFVSWHIALDIYRLPGQYVPGKRLNAMVGYTFIVIVQQCVSNFMGKAGERTWLARFKHFLLLNYITQHDHLSTLYSDM